ncbi:hypothetical protein LA76x_3842 [Lysobacter antibioticus]|uniref:Uncharacterized protein n=1 Tax=Lysobacter antibioticus TaxID=84531 RepID=A0A0S2FEN4_LYSAN|nr:hypothetical protein LA76x_3842 [Lysobacter antibioticus]
MRQASLTLDGVVPVRRSLRSVVRDERGDRYRADARHGSCRGETEGGDRRIDQISGSQMK